MSRIELKNAQLLVVIDVDHGAEILSLSRADSVNVLAAPDWQTPLPANTSRSYGDDKVDWHSEYRGGWQELFPNCGEGGEVLGTRVLFHGEASRARWDWRWLDEGTQVVMSTGVRLPLVIERTMRLDPARPVLLIEERIWNEGKVTVPYIWSHHPAFGPPLTEAGAHIDAPVRKVMVDGRPGAAAADLVGGSEQQWPLAQGSSGQTVDLSIIPEAPAQRMCYLELSEGWYAIRNPQRSLGFALAWDLQNFPYAWLWQEIEAEQEFPWYGRGLFTAIEPATQWPGHGLAEAIKHGTARSLEPGQEVRTSLACALFAADERAVSHVSRDGTLVFAS